MKNYAPLFIAILSTFSFSCFAQSDDHFSANTKMENSQLMADMSSNNDLAMVSYHVEERINMNFGSRVTSYNVSDISFVGTNDLGPNNIRIVTPKYAKAKQKYIPTITNAFAKNNANSLTTSAKLGWAAVPPVKVRDHVNITMIDTYERILDKGYKTVDMMMKVADSHYFEDDMEVAAKWYAELFSVSSNIEAVYYFRYAQALIATKQVAKGKEMMKIYESMNL